MANETYSDASKTLNTAGEKTNAQNSSPFLSTVLLASQGQLSKKKKKRTLAYFDGWAKIRTDLALNV